MKRRPANKLKRVYHPYHNWEEINFNMWGSVKDRKKALASAIKFTGNHILYGEFMLKVVSRWPISCENALTDHSLNKRAWIGHAACALARRLPEDITRLAWGKLSDEQRFLANRQADFAILKWTETYIQNKEIRDGMGKSLLP